MTRFKMDVPSFDALRIALEDAEARVRIEDLIPESIPMILGVQVDGGFLSGQVLQFSPNLNCIIGGRGTGKSTTFEAIRCLSGESSESKVVDSEAWPEELHLFWQDPAGQQHSLFRAKEGVLANLDNPQTGPCAFGIDCFGQGEAARISAQAQNNPLALLHYLDRFVILDEAASAERVAREKLLNLQTEIEKAEQNVQLIPQYERALATTRQQLAALQKPEVKELIELHRQLATEKELRQQIASKLHEAKNDAARSSPSAAVAKIQELAEPENLAVGAVEFRSILQGASVFRKTAEAAESQTKSALATLERLINGQFVSWGSKETEAPEGEGPELRP